MLRNGLRKELEVLLASSSGSRKPVLRRSYEKAWLYATDLPEVLDGSIPETLGEALNSAKWEYLQEGSWIMLRTASPEPPENWYGGAFGPEAACCRSLLERNSDLSDALPDDTERILIKAGEEGEAAYEAACACLHREWAERLRLRESLPAISCRYFGA